MLKHREYQPPAWEPKSTFLPEGKGVSDSKGRTFMVGGIFETTGQPLGVLVKIVSIEQVGDKYITRVTAVNEDDDYADYYSNSIIQFMNLKGVN